MNLISNNNIQEIKKEFPEKIFRIGIFLLPTVLSFSIIFILISVFLNIKRSSNKYLKDNYNKVLLLSSVLMTLSSLYNFKFADYSEIGIDNNYLFLLGLFNWIPFFILFWGVRNFLNSPKKRIIFAKYLVAGTIPVILLAIGQKWLNINGPFNFLDGLIIWYQRPITRSQAITSIFNNPNYLGAWLSATLPFCIVLIKNNQLKIRKLLISSIILISNSTIIIFTNSRNAILGLLLAAQLLFIQNKKYLFCSIGLILISLIILNNYDYLPQKYKSFLEIIPERYLREFSSTGYKDLDITRFNIWIKSIGFIATKPITGWGAGTFPDVFLDSTSFYKGHCHNLPLQIAFSYGVLPAILISSVITLLLIKALLKVYVNQKKSYEQNIFIFDQGWVAAALVIYVSHLFDITYFDGRISLLSWILMAGLRNIISEKV